MSSPSKLAAPPRLYLVSPPIDDPIVFRARVEALVTTGLVDVFLLRVAGGDLALRNAVADLGPLIQDAGVALLIEAPDDLRLAARLGVDGVHVDTRQATLNDAISSLKPERIVGVGGLDSRHDAMEAGEKDIDYVMFGEPRGDGSAWPLATMVDRAAWWAEIFNVPCVAYAPDLAAVAPLARTGIEFLALGPFLFADGADGPALLREAVARMTEGAA